MPYATLLFITVYIHPWALNGPVREMLINYILGAQRWFSCQRLMQAMFPRSAEGGQCGDEGGGCMWEDPPQDRNFTVELGIKRGL